MPSYKNKYFFLFYNQIIESWIKLKLSIKLCQPKFLRNI